MSSAAEKAPPRGDVEAGGVPWIRFVRATGSLLILLVLSVAIDLWFRLQIVVFYRNRERRRIAAVNRLPPVKRLFMRHAMGLVGDLPRLVRGQAL